MRRIQPAIVGGLSAALLACGGSASNGPGGPSGYPNQPPGGNPVATASVSVTNNAFVPASVSLTTGGSVTWTWVGSGHSVTSDGTPSFSGAPVSSPPSTLGPVIFSTAGTYQYYCTVHAAPGGSGGGMLGSVFVQ